MRERAMLVVLAATVGLLLGTLMASRAEATDGPGAWEYRCESKWPEKIWKPEAIAKLNELGGEGWRLMPSRYAVSSSSFEYADVYCFERKR